MRRVSSAAVVQAARQDVEEGGAGYLVRRRELEVPRSIRLLISRVALITMASEQVQLWNAVTALTTPRVRDVLNTAGVPHSSPVFTHDESLRWLAPNVFFEIGLADRYSDSAFVTNAVLVFTSRYFLAPTTADVMLNDLRGVYWGALALPCDAQSFAEHVSEAGLGRLNLVTESGEDGVSWKALVGAMTFEFQSLDDARDPKRSSLASLTYSFNLGERSAVSPTLRVDRSS